MVAYSKTYVIVDSLINVPIAVCEDYNETLFTAATLIAFFGVDESRKRFFLTKSADAAGRMKILMYAEKLWRNSLPFIDPNLKRMREDKWWQPGQNKKVNYYEIYRQMKAGVPSV